MNFIIFISIVLSIYGLLNFYVIRSTQSLFSNISFPDKLFVILVIILSLSFIAGRVIERFSVNFLSTFLIWVGAVWMGFFVYLFLQFLVLDIINLFAHIFKISPSFINNNLQKVKIFTGILIYSVTFLFMVFGYINTWFPAVKNINLEIHKKAGHLHELKIVALSDLHLGTLNGKRFLSKVVSMVNAQTPDIILIPGDIIDEDIAPVLENDVGKILKEFKSKYGVYAVTGNHEYIGGVEKAKKYLAEHKINLLNDKAVLIDNSFYIAGREDLSIKQFTSKVRKDLFEILNNIDNTYPVILLDHQPFKLENAMNHKIDLQLSGHTHHGQLWPFNFITKAVYELSWGYKKKSNTHFYVSCGVGGWGPPIRTVSRPEIVNINVTFK